jgi:hypothetical protein
MTPGADMTPGTDMTPGPAMTAGPGMTCTTHPPAGNGRDARKSPPARAALLALIPLAAISLGCRPALAATPQQYEARAFALGVPYNAFNWQTAHAQDRGCSACHGDHLAADLSQLPVHRAKPDRHGIFVTTVPLRVEDCLPCHGPGGSKPPFAASMHSLHLHSATFTGMGGNCDTCHVITIGKFLLYDDETRYTVLNGLEQIPTPAFTR